MCVMFEVMNEEIALKVQFSCQNLCKLLNEEKNPQKKVFWSRRDVISSIALLDELLVNFKIINEKQLTFNHLPNCEENICSIIKSIADVGLVKDFGDSEEREFDEKDFPHVADSAIKSFSCLKLLLPKVSIQCKKLTLYKDIIIPVLRLCGTHHDIFVWSNESTVLLSKETLDILFTVCDCNDLATLLCIGAEDHLKCLLKNLLLLMRPSLTKETWMRNPSTCQIFKWVLLNVKHQHLSKFLDDVLPASLIFVDHHAVANKVLGLKCLDHIIDNVPPAELKMYGRADVIFDILNRLLYYNEPPVIEMLYPCLIRFLHGQERDPRSPYICRNWNMYDDIYQKLLFNMDMEERVILRRAYTTYAMIFVEKMGITICKHLKHTVEIFLKYLEVHDGPKEISRINTLLALRSLIKVAWTRMPHHMLPILKGLVFLVYDIETDCGTNVEIVKQEILTLCKECMLLLKMTSSTKFEAVTQGMTELRDLPAVGLLKSVIEAQ